MFEIEVEGEARQEHIGMRLALNCPPPCIVYLEGDLGAGKTTLARGFLRGLGYRGRVKSPTYTLLEPYGLEGLSCYHFDLYRLTDPEELEYLGIEDLMTSDAILLIEWPEHGAGVVPAADIKVRISHRGRGRDLLFSAGSEQGDKILQGLRKTLEKV
ncbi:MAG: tRNA (adenosine(37)-N6)-threonylcarbamoyltransferase complex ATPase subunit type 1 TsaE [Candidatus Thiodiazotropha sp. (ex Epidulcina cf. delphinae)]|nr:tRNA (adenosine(37)-N6)-threonylcarbamoyltransferase complex ATPase subunit type 1 TsaE [Candidatus Thiodiazotropha sp. (ex Epidulcina cf. delphinae)]